MPSAICNTCGSLVHWPYGKHQKKQKCSCGSQDITQVKGSLNATTMNWDYKDRHGTVRKTEPVFHGAHKPLNVIQ